MGPGICGRTCVLLLSVFRSSAAGQFGQGSAITGQASNRLYTDCYQGQARSDRSVKAASMEASLSHSAMVSYAEVDVLYCFQELMEKRYPQLYAFQCYAFAHPECESAVAPELAPGNPNKFPSYYTYQDVSLEASFCLPIASQTCLCSLTSTSTTYNGIHAKLLRLVS